MRNGKNALTFPKNLPTKKPALPERVFCFITKQLPISIR